MRCCYVWGLLGNRSRAWGSRACHRRACREGDASKGGQGKERCGAAVVLDSAPRLAASVLKGQVRRGMAWQRGPREVGQGKIRRKHAGLT